MDYLNLNKPLPSECRDSVTGNAYFHGCIDELTWYLEGKTSWLAGIVLASCMIAVSITCYLLKLNMDLPLKQSNVT